jgi:hypothetical protein
MEGDENFISTLGAITTDSNVLIQIHSLIPHVAMNIVDAENLSKAKTMAINNDLMKHVSKSQEIIENLT